MRFFMSESICEKRGYGGFQLPTTPLGIAIKPFQAQSNGNVFIKSFA
jgi:hypothetical protein